MPTPGGTLSLLFTDLVDSTSTANRVGDERAQALRRAHDRILLHQIQLHDGTVVKNTGDGFFAVFTSAKQAVACARDIQRAIADHQAEGRYAELSVRIGVHTGEPTEEAGDYFGVDVALASRVQSEAEAGEILISDVTQMLIRSHDIAVEDAGVRTFKGFAEPLRTFRVVWRREESHRRQSRFVGRLDERRRLGLHLDALLTQRRGGVVLIAGEPGIGKTRLATEFAIDAQDRGVLVLSGRAYEPEGLPPYHPFAEAFARHILTRGTSELKEQLGEDAAYLARIAPEIRAVIDVQEPASLTPEAERHLLLDAAVRFVARISSETPLLLVLDDFHWADHASISMLQHIIRRLESFAMLIVVTYREVEASADHPLSTLAAEIARRGPGECITLAPLTATESSSLVEDVFGERPSDDVFSTLFATAEGNPFFTEELVRNLRGKAPDQLGLVRRPSTSTVPEAVRQVIVQRLSLVAEPVFELLTECAVLGHGFTLARVAAVTDLDEDTLLDRIEVALDARALREAGDALEFAHPLIRETLYQGLPNARRRALHRKVAEALERLAGTNVDGHVSELAHHYLEGATEPAHAEAAAKHAQSAAAEAMTAFAYEDAAAHLGRACELFKRLNMSDSTLYCNLLLSRVDALTRAGEGPRAEETLREAASLAEALKVPEVLARCAIAYHKIRGSSGTIDEFFIHLVETAAIALPDEDSPLRARLLSVRPTALYHVEPHERLMQFSEDAIAMARRLNDQAALVSVLGATHDYRYGPTDAAAKLESATELLRLAEQLNLKDVVLRARRHRISDLLQLGEIRAVDDEIEALGREATILRLPLYSWRVGTFRAMRALLDGRLDEAEHLAQEAYEIGKEVPGDSSLAFQFLAIQLFAIRREQGRLAEMLPTVKLFVEQYPALRWRVGVAYVLCEMDRLDEAREEFERIATGGFAELPRDFNWLISATILAEICAWLHDADHASVLYDLMLPFADQAAVIGDAVACNGSVSRYLGLLAGTFGAREIAERHFRAALDMNSRMDARVFIAHTKQEFAGLLFECGDQERSSVARELLSDAVAEAQALGLKHVEERSAELLREMGEIAH